MRLLILTQIVDSEDPVLGFFHHWLEEFAKKEEQVTVICLQKGSYHLPGNVRVFSLGKERGLSRVSYLFNFYRYIFSKWRLYDVVFVHMNEEYVLLGGVFWRLFGKKIELWRNHKRGSIMTRLAVMFAHRVFYTSPDAYIAHSRKAVQMPVGIDTDVFKKDPHVRSKSRSLLSFGRISPVKRLDVLIEALKILNDEGVPFEANIYGEAPSRDVAYYEHIRNLGKALEEKGKIHFYPAVAHRKAPNLYNSHEIFINLTPSGSFDKTILEAAACETLVLSCNAAFTKFVPPLFSFREGDAKDLAEMVKNIFALSVSERESYGKSLRKYTEENHSLKSLIAQYLCHGKAY